MNKVILSIEGMSCSACAIGLEKFLQKQKGIYKVSVNLVLAQALITYEDTLGIEDLNHMIKEAGFKSLGIYNPKAEKKTKNVTIIWLFAVLALFLLYISMGSMFHFPMIPFLNIEYPLYYAMTLLILTVPFLLYGFDIFKSGVNNLIHKTPNMDTLVTIGVFSSFLYSISSLFMILVGKTAYVHQLYFESSAIVIFFIKLGRYIDVQNKEKTKESIRDLVQVTPEKALLKTKNGEQEITIDEVKKGDILICKPGMKVSVDGTLTKGTAHVDESFITGESMPIKKEKDDRILAGSFSHDGYFEYRAERIGKDSTISEIVKLVIEATSTKAPIARIADQVSQYFVPSIIILSVLTLIGYLCLGFGLAKALTHFVTVLVVACPCALGLATPLAIVISEGLCAKKGIIVKTSEALENAHKVDTILFDKTGTLTYGKLQISKIYHDDLYKEEELMRLVASLEVKTTHPIGKAFTDYLEKHKIKPVNVEEFKNLAGLGIMGKINNNEYYIGNQKLISNLNLKNHYEKEELYLANEANSIVYVVENKKIIALIGIKDMIRTNVVNTINGLKQLEKKIIMLTGDNELTANAIAKQLGIHQVIANVMPKDKAKQVQKQMNHHRSVMMVGDGINDAPALSTASIGVSLSSGTDIANNSADVILMNNHLNSIIQLIMISKKTVQNIKQNLFWAFFYNICMIPIAIGLFSPFGIDMNPMLGGFAMTLSSLTIMLNALRLKRIQ